MNPPVLGPEVIFYWHIIQESHLGRLGWPRQSTRSSPSGSRETVATLEILRRALHTHSGGLSAVAAVSEAQECWSSRIKRFCETLRTDKRRRPLGRSARGANDKSRFTSSEFVANNLNVHTTCWSKSMTNHIGFDLPSSDTRASCQIVDPHDPDFEEQLSPGRQSRRMTSKFRSQGQRLCNVPLVHLLTGWKTSHLENAKQRKSDDGALLTFRTRCQRLSYVKQQKNKRKKQAVSWLQSIGPCWRKRPSLHCTTKH